MLLISNYIGYYTLSAGTPVSLVTPTYWHIMIVLSATAIYIFLILYFSGGANTYAILNRETLLRYTGIA